ncbi:hypothetical protein ACHQM5_015851 [Ranunculus cassubicifolius]
MCIALFVWQAHPLYPFLLLLNRDEFHNRPTKEVSWWDDGEILGGRDEVAGGTWLGCTKDGKFAFLTNILESHPSPVARTRGDLPVRFLKGIKSPREYAEDLSKESDQYNGFNLIVMDISTKTMVYVTNRPKGEPITVTDVSPGIHVLTNATLDSPWHKAEHLHKNFSELFTKYKEDEVPLREFVIGVMSDTVKADKQRLPNICSPDWELSLSPIFVEVDTPLGCYGTRSTIAISVKTRGEVSFYEKYLKDEKWNEHTVNYQIIQKTKKKATKNGDFQKMLLAQQI